MAPAEVILNLERQSLGYTALFRLPKPLSRPKCIAVVLKQASATFQYARLPTQLIKFIRGKFHRQTTTERRKPRPDVSLDCSCGETQHKTTTNDIQSPRIRMLRCSQRNKKKAVRQNYKSEPRLSGSIPLPCSFALLRVDLIEIQQPQIASICP